MASTAVAGSIGCGSTSRSAIRAAIATGQSMPGATRPSTRSAAASRSIAGSSSTEMIARRSAKRKPGAAGLRSTRDDEEPAAAGGLEEAELAGARA